MNNKLSIVLCVLLAATASGCASFAARSEKPVKRTVYYPGVYRDVDTIKKITGESKKPAEKPKDPETKEASSKYALIWLPVPIIDIPFSVIWDTLCLPVDYYNRDAIKVAIGADAYK